MIKRKTTFENRRNLIIKKKRILENLIKFLNIMIWIKVFDVFDDTNKNEKYKKNARKKGRTFLKTI